MAQAAQTTRTFKSPLQTGDILYFEGVAQSSNFEVILETETGDIAFHFKQRFDKDQRFKIVILVHNARYKVAVNGDHYTDYKHLIRKEDIRKLVVQGDVKELVIRYQEANPHGKVPQENIALQMDVIFNPKLTYKGTIKRRGLTRGTMIRITGVHDGAGKLDFIFTPSPEDTPIAGRSLIVDINADSKTYCYRQPFDDWEKDERHGWNFGHSKTFDIIVLVEAKGFKIFVDEAPAFEDERPWLGIDQLEVSGNAQIFMIQVQKG